MKCRILAGHHEFGRKTQEVIPEKPKMCLNSSRVTVALHPRAYVRNEGGRGLRPAEETVRTEEHGWSDYIEV